MALVPCRECGAEISTEATACPKCGAVTRPKRRIWPWVLGAPVAGLGAMLLLGAMVGPPSEISMARQSIRECWNSQQSKSLTPGGSRFVAGACEQMERDFTARFGRTP